VTAALYPRRKNLDELAKNDGCRFGSEFGVTTAKLGTNTPTKPIASVRTSPKGSGEGQGRTMGLVKPG
jgi:hypothetical protein